MLDLIIRGGTVVAPWSVSGWDVAIQGERIIAVAEPGTLTRDVGRVVDAAGTIVVPGGIEPHAHASLPLPYPGARDQGLRAAPADVISKACVFGGTTTVIDFANWRPGIRGRSRRRTSCTAATATRTTRSTACSSVWAPRAPRPNGRYRCRSKSSTR